MSLREWFRTYLVKDSYEYVIHTISNIALRGDESLYDRAELCRLKRELLNYLIQNLDTLKKKKDPLDYKFGFKYAIESLTIIEYMQRLNIDAITLLQQSMKLKDVIEPIPRNNEPLDINALAALYAESVYKKDFELCITLIDNHIARYYENN